MKSWVGAWLSLVLGVVLGFGAFTVLQIGSVGRDLLAVAVPTAAVLFFVGLVYGRTMLRGVGSCLGGIALYAATVAAVVSSFAGGAPTHWLDWNYVLSWTGLVMAVTVTPWGAGALIGRWSQRFQLTP